MKKMIFGNHKNKTLIAAYDGDGIRGIVAGRNGILAENHFPDADGLRMVLEFGRKQGCREFLVLRVSDVREIEVKLGNDLDADERHSAIEYAAAANAGDHSGNQRISYMDGMLHDFRSGILVSFFDAGEIVTARKESRTAGMKFLGVTNFKQLLMAEHFSNAEQHNDAFLFLLGGHGFLAYADRNKLVVRNLPFGVPSPGDSDDWQEKMPRRLAVLKHKSVLLYTPSATPELCDMLSRAAEAESVTACDWRDALDRGCLFFLAGGGRLIKPALPPPKPKDPKASGTVIGLSLLGAVLFSMAFLVARNFWVLDQLEHRYETNQAIEQKVKDEEAKLKKLEQKVAVEQDIYQMLEHGRRVSRKMLLVVNLLGRYPLQYIRINTISEESGGIYMEGETVWQPDLSKFFSHFEGVLNQYKLTLFSDGLTKEKDGRMTFRVHIGEGGK